MAVRFDRIQTLRDFLATLPPEQVDMSVCLQIDRETETAKEARTPKCGTVACIAGWAAVLSSEPEADVRSQRHGSGALINDFEPWDLAVEYLGLAEDGDEDDAASEADHVFFGYWSDGKSWSDGSISRDEVIAYLDKVLAEKNVMVKL